MYSFPLLFMLLFSLGILISAFYRAQLNSVPYFVMRMAVVMPKHV